MADGDERRSAARKHLRRFLVPPTLVAKLHGVSDGVRQAGEEGIEPLQVLVEGGRELPEDDLERPQLADPIQKRRQRPFTIAKLLQVGDRARTLEDEVERSGQPAIPPGDHPLEGQPIEGGVDLDGVEPFGVEREALRAFYIFRIERAGPVVVGPTGGANVSAALSAAGHGSPTLQCMEIVAWCVIASRSVTSYAPPSRACFCSSAWLSRRPSDQVYNPIIAAVAT